MAHIRRVNNIHKVHATVCTTCGRNLPKRAYHENCATCIKKKEVQ